MAQGNVIVSKVISRTTFEVDRGSYQKTIKKIRSVGAEWDRVAGKMRPLRFKFKENGYTKARRKAQDEAAKAEAAQAKAKAKAEADAAKARLAAERKTQTIRAKGIRFSTAAANANVTPAQRAGHLQEFGQLTRQYKNGAIALQEYNARVSKLQQTMRAQGKVGMRGATIPVTAKVNKLDTSMIEGAGGAITIAATVALSGKIMTTGQDFESALSGLTAVTGSAENAGKEFAYLKEQSNRLGLDLIQTAKNYTQFSAAVGDKLPQAQTRAIFEGASEWGLVTGASKDEASRALKALNQMMSKGTVMSEELKGQLSEALPGSVGLFVKALNQMKGTTNLTEKDLFRLMEDGQLLSKDILPKVAEQMKIAARNGGALDKAMKSNRASWQRLQTAMQNAMNLFFISGFGESLTSAFDSAAAAVDGAGGAIEVFGHVAGQIVSGATDAFTELHDIVVFTFRMIEYYANQVGISSEQLKSWADMAAYAAGVALFAGSIWKLGGALKWLVTMLNPLTKLLGVMQGIAALGGIGGASDMVTSGGQPGKDGKPGKTPTTKTPKVGGKGLLVAGGGILGALASNPYTYPVVTGAYAINDTDNATREADGLGLIDSIAARWKAGGWANHEAQKASIQQSVDAAVPTFIPPTTATVTGGYGNPLMTPPAWLDKPLNVNVNVKVQDGEVKGLVQSEIERNTQHQFNMLTGGN